MTRLSCSLVLTGVLAVAESGCRDTVTMTEPPLAPLVALSNAAQPVPAGSTTTMSVSGCDFTVTYTWNGFKGRGVIATFGLYEALSGGIDASFDLLNVEGQLGKSGTQSHTFNLTANAHTGRTIVARGELVDGRKFTQISGSSSRSSNTTFSTCG